jgi:hypothetical protein
MLLKSARTERQPGAGSPGVADHVNPQRRHDASRDFVLLSTSYYYDAYPPDGSRQQQAICPGP